MKKLLFLGILALTLGAVCPAQASGFFSVNIGLPVFSVNIGVVPPPVYVTPAPVYVAPPQVVVRPMPVYGSPRFVVARPPAVVYRSYRPYVAVRPYCR